MAQSITRPKNITDAQWNQALELYYAAKSKGDRYPELTVAQAALETGWFKSPAGRYNYFGQKATSGQQGSTKSTKEVAGGKTYSTKAKFRDYSNINEAVDDRLSKWGKKYENANNVEEAIGSIWKYNPNTGSGEGYATDTQYGPKLKTILGSMGVSTSDTGNTDQPWKQYGVDTSINLPMNTGEYQTAPEMSEATTKESLEAEQAKAELLEKQREKDFLAELQANQQQAAEIRNKRYEQSQQEQEQDSGLDPSYYQVPQIELPNYEAIKYQQAQNQAQIPQDEFQLGGKKYSEQNGRLVVTTKVVNTPNGPRYYQAKSPDYNFSIELTDAKRVGDSIPKANLDPHIIEALNRRQDGGEIDLQYKDGGSIPQRYKNMGFTHVGQKKAGDGQKKWKVLAKKGDKYKVVQGGYRGMKDFSQHGSKKRQDNFWSRMGGRDSAKANDPFSPLYWHKRLGKWEDGGEIEGEVECTNCGWSWDKSESIEKDMYNCHKCGGKNTGEAVEQFQQGGEKEVKSALGAGKFNTTTGDTVVWGTPEYEAAYNRGEVVTDKGGRSEVTLEGGQLDDVVIKNNYKRGFWGKYRDKIIDENKDASILGAIIGTPISAVTSLPQLAATYGITGKMERPSEAMDIKNPYLAMGVDALTDPADWIGVGELSTVGRLSKAEALAKLAKIPTSIAPELREGLRTQGLTFNGTPRKYPINNSQRAVTEDVDRLFEEFPELAKTGSKEEYIKYLETIQPETTQPGIFYRGSNQSHNPSEWMPNPSGGNNLGEGFYFTPDPIKTQRYGKEMKALLDIKDPTYTSLRLNSNGLMVPSGMKAKDIVGEGSAAISIQNPNRDLFTEMGSRGEGYMHKYKGPLDEQGFPAATRPYESNPNYTEYSTVDELVVPDNSQIHVLGSDADKELFKNYINNKKTQFQEGGNFNPESARDNWVAKTGLPWSEAKRLGYTDGTKSSNIELLDKLKSKNFEITKDNKKMDIENDNEFFPQVPINPIWDRKPPVTKKSVTAPVRKAKKDIKKVDPLKLLMDFATGNMGNNQNLQNGVITDKRSNTNYVVENGVVTRTFPVLTALNPDVNVNDKGVVYLDSHPESRGTPVGAYVMDPKDDIYGEPGFRINPIPAFGQPAPKAKDIALHVTYPGEFKQRNALYSQDANKRYASYGCVNCRKPDLKYLTDRFKKGDTTIVIDSKNRKDADFLGRKLFSRR